MNILAITPNLILLVSFILIMIYLSALYLLIKNKSGILQYIIFLIVPILGPIGIILGNISYKKIDNN